MTNGHMTDQPDDSAQPAAGTSPAAVEGDDSAKGPTNESTIAKQPQPVSVPRVPLRRGQIADSFKTLVKQASFCAVVVFQSVYEMQTWNRCCRLQQDRCLLVRPAF